MDLPPLWDYSRSLAVVMGTWDYEFLEPVPAAEYSFRRMKNLLTGPLCGWPEGRILTLPNVTGPGNVPDQLITAFDAVPDIALFYFVGHGQLSPDDELCLGLTKSRPDPNRRAATSLRFPDVRQALRDSPAAIKIVILDCCYAGLGLEPPGHLNHDVLDGLTTVTGSYTIAATGAYTTVWYQDDPGLAEPQTYFTKYLADLVEEGIPGQPPELRLDPLFRQLQDNLARQRLPVPLRRAVDDARDFAFAYNAAPPDTRRDPEQELNRIGRQLTETEKRRAAGDAEISDLKAQAAKLERELARLQDLFTDAPPRDTSEQRQIQHAAGEASRQLNDNRAAQQESEEQQASEEPQSSEEPQDPALAFKSRNRRRWFSSIGFHRTGRPKEDAEQVPPPPTVPVAERSAEGYPRRHLKGQCPRIVRPGELFSVLARVVVGSQPGAAPLRAFGVGAGGREVLLDLYAPGLQVRGPQRRTLRVPPGGDSEPVMFELEATAPGPQTIEITAWADGTYLGQLNIETTAVGRRVVRHGQQDMTAELGTGSVPGLVTLVVRHDPRQNSYRFEFRDVDNPEEVVSDLAYEPGPRVERLLAELDRLAKGGSGYSAAETRRYLTNAGAALWTELLPARLREQFWERQDRISELTILADSDVVPWELLYPLDPGHDEGFLVEQFPVTRMMFGCRPTRKLRLDPALFVLPDGSPSQARTEVAAMLDLFYPSPDPARARPVVDGLTPLLERIDAGDFGLLHFACHNAFDPDDGSSIMLDRRQFTPTLLTTAAISKVLVGTGPTVFINACRSAGTSPSYHRLDGWARKFLDAGAAVFIGSLWAVRDSTAQDFAAELYRHLQHGEPLGNAVMAARRTAAEKSGDPTWLAYAVYGDPRATLQQRQ